MFSKIFVAPASSHASTQKVTPLDSAHHDLPHKDQPGTISKTYWPWNHPKKWYCAIKWQIYWSLALRVWCKSALLACLNGDGRTTSARLWSRFRPADARPSRAGYPTQITWLRIIPVEYALVNPDRMSQYAVIRRISIPKYASGISAF